MNTLLLEHHKAVSPLLFNIYTFELDKYIYNNIIKNIINENTNKKRKANPIFKKYKYKISQQKIKYKRTNNLEDKKEIKKDIKKLIIERSKIPSYIPETLKKSIVYTRYADDWVLVLNTTKQESYNLREKIGSFTNSILKMQLDKEKTKITKTTKGFNFLGFTYIMSNPKTVKRCRSVVRNKNSTQRILKRTTSRITSIYPDKHRVLNNLKLRGYCEIKNNPFFPMSKPQYIPLGEYEIVIHYRQVMTGLFNYYRFTKNNGTLNYSFYILQYSCAKTIARKQKLSIAKIFKKYGKQLIISLSIYKNGKQDHIYNSLPTLKTLKNKKTNKTLVEYDPFYVRQYWRTSFKVYQNCCICGSTEHIAMHHLNSLRNLKNNKKKNNTNL